MGRTRPFITASFAGRRRASGKRSSPASPKPERAGRRTDDRRHACEGAPLGRRGKRGAEAQAIGRSRGARTAKIHAAGDEYGRPRRLIVRPGHRGDAPVAAELVGAFVPALCVADAAYDSDALRRLLIDRGTTPVIPNNPTRKRHHPFDRRAYRLRNVIAWTFSRLKDWRRVATRYHRLASNVLAAVASFVAYWL